MFIMVDKTLSALAYPLGLALTGLLLGLVLAWLRMTRPGLILCFTLVAVLWVASTPLVARFLLGTLERQYPAQAVDAYAAADVAVVLGGGISVATQTNPYPDAGDAADRVLHAMRVLRAGKAGRLLLSGGSVFDAGAPVTEADAMADLLQSLGVERGLLVLERNSRNTRENAVETARLWKAQGYGSGLLITSASHMPRALAAFRAAGLDLVPAATDAIADRYRKPYPLAILPDVESLEASTRAIKEWLGLFVYRMRGWV